MARPVQWRASATIHASREEVWDAVENLARIPDFHPDGARVELLSGNEHRTAGVEYRCVVSEGPRTGSCVERVLETVPYQKTTTLAVQDTWGLDRLLREFVTETVLSSQDGQTTTVTMLGYYRPAGIKAWILNLLFIRRLMAKRGRDVLSGIKTMVESLRSSPR